MWCGRFTSPQFGHSLIDAATNASWERRMPRRALVILLFGTAIDLSLISSSLPVAASHGQALSIPGVQAAEHTEFAMDYNTQGANWP